MLEPQNLFIPPEIDDLTIPRPGRRIISMMGHTAAGKTTLARYLAAKLDCPLLSSAEIKDELTGGDVDCLSEPLRNLSYTKMLHRARNIEGTVILDASFHRRFRRAWLYETAEALGAQLTLVHVTCPDPDEVARRIQARQGITHYDALADTIAVYDHLEAHRDPWTLDEAAHRSLSLESLVHLH